MRCRFCGGRYASGGIARHISACKARAALVDDAAETGPLDHLVITRPRESAYRLDLLAAPDLSLEELDAFLRDIWLDCCGHMSAFRAAGVVLVSDPDGRFGTDNADVPLSRIAASGSIRYLYDMGTPTELQIRRLAPVSHPRPEDSIAIAARNEPPSFSCACGSEAIVVDRYADWTAGFFLCSKCMMDGERDPGSLAPLTNSPRMGICGYRGPGSDPEGEYSTRADALHEIEEMPLARDQQKLDTAQEDERAEIVGEYVDRLSRSYYLSATARSAGRFISRNIGHFEQSLGEVVASALGPDWALPYNGRAAPHLYALYLLGTVPNGELFSSVTTAVRAGSPVAGVWADAFSSRASTPLFASLCSEAPHLLAHAAAEPDLPASFRAGVIRALATLYLNERLQRSDVIEHLSALADVVVASGDESLAEALADAVCAVYPEDLIRVVQRLDREGLLDTASIDYLDRVKALLDEPVESHLLREKASSRHRMLEDPVGALETVFRARAFVADDVSSSRRIVSQEPPTVRMTDESYVPRAGTYVRGTAKVGRNEPCPCGSGKKYKRCCGR